MILPDWPALIMFLSATLMLNITPGADVLYIANCSLSQDKTHGVLAALGISTGLVIHVLLIAAGLGEIMSYSPLAFWCLKTGGAIYLMYLAWKAFTSHGFSLPTSMKPTKKNLLKTYLGGALTTLLNPKVILFFLTFLPQFIDPEKGHFIIQLISLGGIFIICGTVVDLSYALFFSVLKEFLIKSKKVSLWFQRLTGVLFATFACKLLLAEGR